MSKIVEGIKELIQVIPEGKETVITLLATVVVCAWGVKTALQKSAIGNKYKYLTVAAGIMFLSFVWFHFYKYSASTTSTTSSTSSTQLNPILSVWDHILAMIRGNVVLSYFDEFHAPLMRMPGAV